MIYPIVCATRQGLPLSGTARRLSPRRGPRRDTIRLRPGIARVLRALGIIALAGCIAPAALAGPDSQAVVELRQYTLHPGKRDTLIEIFENNFIESQEQAGLRVLGQFHDLDKPDRFVWLRSFSSMDERREALQTFYGGPVWKANREAANATMIDSDNVLLLRPAYAKSVFDLQGLQRAATDSGAPPAGVIVATIHYLKQSATPALLKLLQTRIEPQLAGNGARVLASFVSESAANTFPALPVRLNEPVLIIFTAYADAAALAENTQRGAADVEWQETQKRLQPYLQRESEVLRLAPTRRSLLRGN